MCSKIHIPKKEKWLYFSHFVFKSACISLSVPLLLPCQSKLYAFSSILWYFPMSVIKRNENQFLNGFSSLIAYHCVSVYVFICGSAFVRSFLAWLWINSSSHPFLRFQFRIQFILCMVFGFRFPTFSHVKLCKYFK